MRTVFPKEPFAGINGIDDRIVMPERFPVLPFKEIIHCGDVEPEHPENPPFLSQPPC